MTKNELDPIEFTPDKSLIKKETAKGMLETFTPAAVQTLVNDLESTDYKARQAAANSILEKAGLGSKKDEPSKQTGPTINFDFSGIIAGLKKGLNDGRTEISVQSLTSSDK